MDDLIEWYGAQLDKDEGAAKAATPGPWRNHDTHLGQYGYAATVLSGEGNDTDLRAWLPTMSQTPWDETRNVWADAAFIAEHDPARVLREIEAKRRVLDWCKRRTAIDSRGEDADDFENVTGSTLEAVVRLLAAPYADRPGYKAEEWAP